MAERVEALDRRGGGRHALPAQHEGLATFDRIEGGRHLPAGAVQVGLDDLEREARGDDCVEGIPPALEHRHPNGRGEPVRRRNHAECAA